MIEDLLSQLLERTENTYFGKYRGYVSKNNDDKKLGRVKAVVPRLLGEIETGWALPCTPYAGPDQGLFTLPDVGTGVWVEFEGGDLSRPIWSGMWWGAPEPDDLHTAESTSREALRNAQGGSEIPKHGHPEVLAEPGVRILKSSSGHYIVMDDRTEGGRLEIHDRDGNRYIFDHNGVTQLISNKREVNEGNSSAQIDGDVKHEIGGKRTEKIGGSVSQTIGGDLKVEVGGTFEETFGTAGYTRRIDEKGVKETFGGPKEEQIRGSHKRQVIGAVEDTAVGGYGVTAGGSLNMATGGAFSVAAAVADGPNAVSMNAGLGNVSINTLLGVCQLGGMTAISPMVLGDGLAMHFTMLVQIMKIINPVTAIAYGPLLDAWAAMTPVVDWSLFGYVKRFPVG